MADHPIKPKEVSSHNVPKSGSAKPFVWTPKKK